METSKPDSVALSRGDPNSLGIVECLPLSVLGFTNGDITRDVVEVLRIRSVWRNLVSRRLARNHLWDSRCPFSLIRSSLDIKRCTVRSQSIALGAKG
jgi:hypothetical protein